MAQPRSEDRSHPAQRGSIARGFGLVIAMLFWLWVALIFSVLLEWTGMLFWWPQEGVAHSRGMLESELSYLNEDFKRSLVVASPARLARSFADGFYRVCFEWTRLESFVHWLAAPEQPGEWRVVTSLRRLYANVADFVLAAMTITQVFAVRLAVLTLALPAFLLASLVGVADGLVNRDLRRWGGGREHGFLYHHAKRPLLPSFVLCWVVYLSLPFSLHPTFVVLPFAALFGGLVALTSSTFKKYL
jgi:integrating conjugative element membrane protein (TIGR03747 family)